MKCRGVAFGSISRAGMLAGAVASFGQLAAAEAQPAHATGTIVGTVKVSESDGKPAVADVIVYVVGFTEPPSNTTTTIVQKGRKFLPDLIAITVNERVAFPNNDPFLHNVFSLSADRKFDLGSYKRGESRDKLFPKPGVVDVYCNIHPDMAATILVLPNRRHTRADANGNYVLTGVPSGEWTVFAYTRRTTKPVSAKVSVKPETETTADFALVRGPEPAHLNKYGEKYKDGTEVYR